ncbi:hypothetical protein JOC54_002874 [Alkalihalobacillus xiaoxiensis]|uniref:Uncharacterized protein n=1 Tax=Shouchella xiaoxiensis TaxID=766895 RepID=A0ABS2SVT2_9BACI|nr:hypothetical protein [Shouchella xiaoxiensis]MBM7839594.1 hypothetical protein [Shouchella xiaoxiensis]
MKKILFGLSLMTSTVFLLAGCGDNTEEIQTEDKEEIGAQETTSSETNVTDAEWEEELEAAYWAGWSDAIAGIEDEYSLFDDIETDIFGSDNSQDNVKEFFETYEELKKRGEGIGAETRAREIQDKKENGFRIGDEVLLNHDNETSMEIISLEEVNNEYYHYLLTAEFYNDEGYDVSVYASNISGSTGSDDDRLIFFTELYNTDEEYGDVITIPTGQSQTIEVEISVNYSLDNGLYMLVEYMEDVNWVIFYEELS